MARAFEEKYEMSFNVNIKTLLIGAVLCMIAGAVGWNYIRSPKIIEKNVEVVKTETKFTRDPDTVDFNTLRLWAKSPIKIEYSPDELQRDYTVLNVRAFDANKETKEEIRVPVYQNSEWKVYAGIGAGVAVATIAGGAYVWKRLR